MEKKFIFSILALCCMTLLSFGQRYQVTTGRSESEEKWAVVEDASISRYVKIGNVGNGDNSRIWISSYDYNGNVSSSAIAFRNQPFVARDISIAPNDDDGKPTYYITGWSFNQGRHQMFVGRIRLNGSFLWYQENPNFTNAIDKEGVAVVTAPNGDAVAVGNAYYDFGNQVYLARFNQGGALVWGRSFAKEGKWMARELALGILDPNCGQPDNSQTFIVTGECYGVVADFQNATLFASLYNDDGAGNVTECWRNLYPASIPGIDIAGTAGYDVVFEPRTQNYCVVGVAERDPSIRGSLNSTPYLVTIDPSGNLLTSAVYTSDNTGTNPMGLYPRAVALGREPGSVVIAGPYYNNDDGTGGYVFSANIPTILPYPAGDFGFYNGPIKATANSYNQQSGWLFDAQPESILLTPNLTTPGYVISSNNWPTGQFGNGDGHLIKTDLALNTPNDCQRKRLENWPQKTEKQIPIPTEKIDDPNWKEIGLEFSPYDVEQRICKDGPPPCDIDANFKDSIVCKTVYYTNTSTGTGPFTYNWLFDDATTSTLPNPVKTYTTCGPHVVRLIVCNAVCCDTIIKTTNIPCCTASSDFCLTNYGRVTTLSYVPQTGTAYSVFLNGSPITWPNNTNQTLTAGNNTVCVKATRVFCGDTCCSTTCKTIRVSDTCNLNANFWFQVRNNGQVVFTNQSAPAGFTSLWQFGNPGNTTSTTVSPTFTYPGPGTYTACLTVKRINGTDSCVEKVCKTIVIDPPCNVLAQFKATHCTAAPLNVAFTNMSTGGVTYLWTFGDPASGINNTSTLANPNHVFTAPGTYSVCLQTLVNNNCWSKSCYSVVVSSATSNTSCTTLPTNPTFRLVEQIQQNEVTLIERQGSNAKNSKPSASPAEVLQKGGVVMFPNPASQKVNIIFAAPQAGNSEVVILNNQGAIVYRKIVSAIKGSNQLSVPTSGLPSGNYHVRVKSNGQEEGGRFMIHNQ
jgi:PKD repeat protein